MVRRGGASWLHVGAVALLTKWKMHLQWGGQPGSPRLPECSSAHLQAPAPRAAAAAGQEYDADTQACIMCPAGTQRTVLREDACVPW